MMLGITRRDLMSVAYQVARAHGCEARFNSESQTAGKKWFNLFMKRHPDLKLRSPEATSLARATGFNDQAVSAYFDSYERLVSDNGFRPEAIFNMDETGHTTVHKPSKVVSTCGKRQVGAITSGERGSNTTGVYCQNAAGAYVPPMLVFKRKRLRP